MERIVIPKDLVLASLWKDKDAIFPPPIYICILCGSCPSTVHHITNGLAMAPHCYGSCQQPCGQLCWSHATITHS